MLTSELWRPLGGTANVVTRNVSLASGAALTLHGWSMTISRIGAVLAE